MNIEILISYIGHSSASPLLEDFLHQNGIRRRPEGDPPIQIMDATNKITLDFEDSKTYNDENEKKSVGDGWFTLRSVYIESGAVGQLPLGINFEINKLKIDEVLGPSIKETADKLALYYKNDYLITIWFDGKSKNVSAVRFSRANVYNRKNYKI